MRRPWKVRWWSQEWLEWCGSSFTTEESAVALAKTKVEEGFGDVATWSTDDNGLLVPGTLSLFLPSSAAGTAAREAVDEPEVA